MSCLYLVIVILLHINIIISAPQTGTEDTADPRTLSILLPQQYNPRCVGAKNDEGTCVELENCVLKELQENYIKYKKYFCVRKSGEVGVCCPDGFENRNKRQTTLAPPTVNINELNSKPQGNPDYTKIGDYQDCGYSSKDISSVTQGRAALRDWPWMVVLLRKEDMFHYCGAVLITTKHVLTASHCVVRTNPDEILARLGEYDFTTPDESKSVDMIVKEIIKHEDYDFGTYENDIAMLILRDEAKYNMYIQPICLPHPGSYHVNQTAIVAGWGVTEYGGPLSNILMEVAVPVWEQKQCVDSFTQTVFNTSMCAGAYEGGKDSCQGDSGGPLMAQRKDKRWMTIGVVSWGIQCGVKGKPGVYTKVTDYLDWIASKILDKS